MASKTVKLDFFEKGGKPDPGSKQILFISLIAMVASQSDDLKSFSLADGIAVKDIVCEDLNGSDPREKRRDIASTLSIGGVFQFRNLKYICRNGRLLVKIFIVTITFVNLLFLF